MLRNPRVRLSGKGFFGRFPGTRENVPSSRASMRRKTLVTEVIEMVFPCVLFYRFLIVQIEQLGAMPRLRCPGQHFIVMRNSDAHDISVSIHTATSRYRSIEVNITVSPLGVCCCTVRTISAPGKSTPSCNTFTLQMSAPSALLEKSSMTLFPSFEFISPVNTRTCRPVASISMYSAFSQSEYKNTEEC